MATLQERIETDYKTAMKAGDRLRVDALRLIKAEIQKAAIAKRAERRRSEPSGVPEPEGFRPEQLADPDVVPVLSRQAKQRQETIDAAQKANRQDIVDQTLKELDILKAYLPQALSTEMLKQLIDDAIKTAGANQGQIMKAVMAKAAGAADGKVVSQLVAERLKPGATRCE